MVRQMRKNNEKNACDVNASKDTAFKLTSDFTPISRLRRLFWFSAIAHSYTRSDMFKLAKTHDIFWKGLQTHCFWMRISQL